MRHHTHEFFERARKIVRRKRAIERRKRWLDPTSFVFLSLLVHGLLILLFLYLARGHGAGSESARSFGPPPRALETRVLNVDQLGADLRRVVESEGGTSVTNPRDRAKYRGERTQRVERETVVPQSGSVAGASVAGRPGALGAPGGAKSKTASTTRRQKMPAEPVAPKNEEASAAKLSRLGFSSTLSPKILPPVGEKPTETSAASGENGQGGAGDLESRAGRRGLRYGSNEPPDSRVAIGSRTLLNTDEYVYAGFYNRLTQEVRPRWEPLVQTILDRSARNTLPSGTFQTLAKFTMDGEGNIVDVGIEESSGRRDIDEAARVALKQVLRLRNPPLSLRDPDGMIRLKLGFTLYLEKSGIRMNYVPDPRLTEGSGSP